jgi:hypothetical protein
MAIQHVLVTPKQRGLPYEQRILHRPEDAVLDVEENALLIAEPRFRVIVRCDLHTGARFRAMSIIFENSLTQVA